MADKRFIDFRVDSTPGSGSFLVGHDSAGTEFRIAVANLLGSIEVPEAQSIYVQYSANGSSWVSAWTSGCKFMRIKIGAGAWSNAMAIADVVNVATMVKVGNTLVGSGSDYVELEAGNNVTLTPDAANNKVTISATGGGGGGGSAVQSDWKQDDDTADDYIKNKPTIPDAQIQSDWSQSDNTKKDFIKNKPTIPSKTSDLTNDAGFLTQHQDISGKVDKETGKGLSTNDYTTTEKNKLSGIAAGAEVNVQSDWNQSDSTKDDYVKNKPTIPDAQIQSDWNQSDNTKKDFIKNKPTIPAAQIQSDWSQSDNTKKDFIKNKPTIPTVNNPLITLTQGGVTKGAFNLNQSSAQTIALDAGGGIVIQVVDTICYEEPSSAVPISQAECFDIANNYFIYLSGGDTWAEDTTIPVVDGMIIYAIFEDAYYIYDSSYGLKPLSKGKSSIETDFDGSYYYINGYLPITDSFGEIELTAFTMPGSSCYLNLNGMFTTVPTEFFEESIGKTHTICIYNSKSTDVDITINNLYLTTKQGFISSGLDSNQSFTVKAGEFAEVNIMFQDSGIQSAYYGNLNNALASIIVKTDFDVNFQSIS